MERVDIQLSKRETVITTIGSEEFFYVMAKDKVDFDVMGMATVTGKNSSYKIKVYWKERQKVLI